MISVDLLAAAILETREEVRQIKILVIAACIFAATAAMLLVEALPEQPGAATNRHQPGDVKSGTEHSPLSQVPTGRSGPDRRRDEAHLQWMIDPFTNAPRDDAKRNPQYPSAQRCIVANGECANEHARAYDDKRLIPTRLSYAFQIHDAAPDVVNAAALSIPAAPHDVTREERRQ